MITSLLRGAVPAPRRFLAPALALVAVAFATSAQAQSVTFAQFLQSPGASRPFVFTSTAGGATFSASTAVDFRFLVGGPGVPTGFQSATLTLTTTTNTPATQTGNNIDQNLNGGTLVITGAGNTNLLTATFSSAVLMGQFRGDGATLTSSGDPNNGNLLFTSQFLTFDNAQSRALALAFTGLLNTVNTANGLSIGANGFLENFRVDGAGSFSGVLAAVPEPASMAMMGLGLAAIPGLVIARRKRAARIA